MLDKVPSPDQPDQKSRFGALPQAVMMRSSGQIGHDIRVLRQSRGCWTLTDLTITQNRFIMVEKRLWVFKTELHQA
jgi:hypothetical protein